MFLQDALVIILTVVRLGTRAWLLRAVHVER